MDGKKLFSLELKTDSYPEETSWKLINLCTDDVMLQRDNYSSKNTISMDGICVPNNAKYQFIIYDSSGNGLCCGDSDFYYYKVEYGGSAVEFSGFFDGFEESSNFGGSCPTPAPTPEPTDCPNGFSEFWMKVNGFLGFGW